MKISSYKELTVWQKSFELAIKIYKLTQKFPKSELYGLTSQLRRAGFSISSNIAEGYVRQHRPEYIHFLTISLGSAAETETQLLLAKELSLAPKEDFKEIEILLNEILKMLFSLIKALKNK